MNVPRRRAVTGILLLDKPAGMSSNQALQRARHALGAAKAGHAGTLDPLATGMLPILFGEATKIAGHLLGERKAYDVRIRLGQATTTYDAEGSIVSERPLPALDAATLAPVVAAFTGLQQQRPPAFSAIKRDGRPLYELARRGEAVEVPAREVVIEAIAITRWEPPLLDLAVTCGSGTYIRSLAHDLGERLGCGGHVTALRRTWVEPFRDRPMVSLDRVLAGEADLLPLLDGLDGWLRQAVTAAEAGDLRQGRTIATTTQDADRPMVALDPAGHPVALVAVVAGGRLQPLRVFAEAA